MSPIRTRTSVTAARLAIPYTSARFPSSSGVGSGTLSFSWDDVLWAAITIGRPNTAYVFQHGEASIHEALFRLSLVRMALEQVPFSDRLHRTDAFRALDPTEKGAVSYFLGMAVCKLFASRMLRAPWLLHLDVFRDQLDPATLGGRSRPDLVGQDANGAWHAFETKGRSSVPSSEDQRKAKAQAQRLVSVNGLACSLHIGSFAFFRGDELEFYWRDPEPEESEKLEPIEIRVRACPRRLGWRLSDRRRSDSPLFLARDDGGSDDVDGGHPRRLCAVERNVCKRRDGSGMGVDRAASASRATGRPASVGMPQASG